MIKSYVYNIKPIITLHKIKDSSTEKDDGSKYLKMSNAHNMIKQFLCEKKMPRAELAEKLGLTLEEFNEFYSARGYKKFANTAGNKLLRLYFRTKWNQQ